MLLRKVIRHVREQSWTAIAIDFCIVVLGVFVGIQVNNWNEARIESQRAHGYLLRIQADLGSDIQSIERRVAYWNKVVDYGHAAIAYAEEGKLSQGSRWQTVLAFYQASQIAPYRSEDTTYREMVNAGDLGLIRNEKLRDALAKYYVTGVGPSNLFVLQLVPEYRANVRGHTPSRVSRHIWASCFSSATGVQLETLLDCKSPISEPEAQAVLDSYMALPELLSELRFWITTQESGIIILGGVLGTAVALAEQVRDELGK
jgi:hypothetical protein